MIIDWFRGVKDKNDLDADKYNGVWNRLVSWWNDHDRGVRAWTNLVATIFTATTATITNLTATNATIPSLLGIIKQALSMTSTSLVVITSGTYTDTNMTLTMTPTSTTSKVFLAASFCQNNNLNAGLTYYRFVRGATDLSGSNGANLGISQPGTGNEIPVTLIYLDTPGTTSSVTYKVQAKLGSGTSVNVGESDSLQILIALEILA